MSKTNKQISVLLIFIYSMAIVSCNKEKEVVAELDPLATAAGTYIGSIEENGKIILNIKANVITIKDSYDKLNISSIGLSAANYQLILTNGRGNKSGFEYQATAQVDGKTLNISGKYSYDIDNSNYVKNNFSFTGIKQ